MVAAGSGKPGTPPAQYTEAREGSATVQTGLIDRGITELNKLIEEAGFDPESWMLKPGTGIRKSDWDSLRRVDGETIVQPMQSVRMELVQRTMPVNVDELVKIAGDQPVARAKERVKDGTFGLALGDLQLGKALDVHTPILTARGWVEHGDLKVGDRVYGADGKQKEVQQVWPVVHGELYRVTLGDGTSIIANGDHEWQGRRKMHPRGYGRDSSTPPWEWREMRLTTSELHEVVNMASAHSRPFSLMASAPIELAEQELPIDPHILGLWLGDGNSHNAHITKSQLDRALLEQYGTEVPSNSIGNTFGVNVPGLCRRLREAKLLRNKHIPAQYLHGSIQQRLALVQGLMDTDGTVCRSGAASFSNTNPQIIQGMRFLLNSLGIRFREKTRMGKLYGVEKRQVWELRFRTCLPIFTLERKLDRMRSSTEREDYLLAVKSVEKIGVGDANCITVDGGLYLAGTQLTVTHNCDGDGPEGTINRFHAYVTEAVAKFAISGYGHAHIAFLGDCIEGFTSQGGRNAWRTTLTTTEQVRILRRLMLWAIDQFVDAGAQRITVVSIPGNHDEAMRQPVATRSDDSWAIDALVAVSDAMELSSRYDHVECFVPGPDEMDVTLDLSGVIVTHNHGHQYLKGDHKKSAFDWWSGQKFSGQAAGDADLMLSGHGHHYQVAERSGKTWCMVPALESLSVWWLHRTGQTGDPGVVIFEAANGVLEVLTRIRLREIGTTND